MSATTRPTAGAGPDGAPPTLGRGVRAMLRELHDGRFRMAETISTRLQGQLPGYTDPGVVLELRSVIRGNLVSLIRRLEGVDSAGRAATEQLARETGELRARQGVPLEEVVGAYRLGGRVLWEEMVRLHRRTGLVSAEVLLDTANQAWAEVDALTMIVIVGYRKEAQRLAIADARERQAALEQLLAGVAAPGVSRLAQALGMPDGPYRLLVLGGRSGDEAMLPDILELPDSLAVAWASRRAGRVALIAGATAELASLPEKVTSVGSTVAVLSNTFTDLADLPSTYHVAQSAIAQLPVGVHSIDAALPLALTAAAPQVMREIRRRTIDRLAAEDRQERDVLLKTLAAMFACQWSASAAAQRLYCHRNTVLRRVAQIQQVLGEDPRDPRVALMWQIALLDAGHAPDAA